MSLVDQAATSTLPKLLQRNAEQDPKGPGIREKTRGVWQTLTWRGYRDQMRDLALGLATLGMALVARLTANCPENPETVQRDLRELGPDAMLAPPRIWENMLTLMQIK